MSKLECAPDIDPLFRKMSKAFDEGGAKGLLLNNLSVANNGCRIEFDSKDDSVAEISSAQHTDAFSQNSRDNQDEKMTSVKDSAEGKDGDIDTSALCNLLQGLLTGSSMESLQLVPQLRSLRDDHAELGKEGYVDKLPDKILQACA